MPLGSPCDYDPEKARKNPNIGKWIYRQNYQKLKEIKKKVDPSNRFDYGLFHWLYNYIHQVFMSR